MRTRPYILLAALLSLGGCTLVRDLVSKTGKAVAPPPVVAPSSILDGEAARLQDSLRPRLEWLAARPPKDWPATLIAFRNESDSANPVRLLVETSEKAPLNAHRKSPRELALEESRRVLARMPWRREALESRIEQPLSVRILYRHRDFLLSSSRFVADTIEVRYADTLAIWKGETLRP